MNFFKSKGHKAAMSVSLFVTSLFVIWIILSLLQNAGLNSMGLAYINPALWLIDNLYRTTGITPLNVFFNLLLEPFVMTYATTWLFIGFWKLMHKK